MSPFWLLTVTGVFATLFGAYLLYQNKGQASRMAEWSANNDWRVFLLGSTPRQVQPGTVRVMRVVLIVAGLLLVVRGILNLGQLVLLLLSGSGA
jgi:hypothetical protein